MTASRSRIAAALAGAMLAAATPTSAQVAEREIPDEYPVYEFVCPDGGYQSGCDASDIERAVDLEGVQAADFAQRCLYRTEAECSVIASGQVNRARRRRSGGVCDPPRISGRWPAGRAG